MELRYRLVVVTGAGGGLGREIAVALSRRGAAVLSVDLDAEAAQQTAARCREARVAAYSCAADLRDEGDLLLLADRMRDLGGADGLVNNAGGWTSGDQYPAAAPADWSHTLDLNLRAPMRLTQLFLEGLPDRRGRAEEPGAVVNVASSAGSGHEGYGSPEYAAAKAGLIRFTTAMGGETTAARARITAVVPGWIGLPRAHDEWAALPEEVRAGLPPLIPPAEVCAVVLDLLAHGAAGSVVELAGGRPPQPLANPGCLA